MYFKQEGFQCFESHITIKLSTFSFYKKQIKKIVAKLKQIPLKKIAIQPHIKKR